MNKAKKIFISLFILTALFLFFSCQEENIKEKDKTIIPVAETVGTGEILNLSDYAKSVEYIPLETSDRVLVGGIQQGIYEKGYIIISDSKSGMCEIFYEDGRFKTQLGQRGQGPGEYIYIYAMTFLSSSNEVFLDINPSRCYLYDLDGNLKKSISRVKAPIPFRAFETVALTPDLYFSDLGAMGDFSYRGLAWGTKNDTSVYKLFPYSFKLDRVDDEPSGLGVTTRKWLYNGEIRYYREERDTIFTINSNLEFEYTFVLDFGKYKEPLECLFFGTRITRNNRCIFLYYSFVPESSRYLFLTFNFQDLAPELYTYEARNPRTGKNVTRRQTLVHGLFDKDTGKLILLNQPVKHKYLGFKNDLDGGPCFWPKYVSSDDKMVTWWNAGDFLELYEKLLNPSPELKKVAEKLTPDDNPVLMVVTLK